MKITKILPAQATPAKAILSRAKHVAFTSAERAHLPSAVTVDGAAVETDIKDVRPLEVGEVLLDEAGHFYVVEAAPETVLIIKGDEEFAAEAAVALLNRGIAVAQIENGFAIAKDEELQQLLTEAGLEFEEAVMPFEPIKVPKRGHGCCCGHHHHEHGEGCGCGGDHHHHHHEDGHCCCGGHHDHEHGEGCGCGGEHHHHHHEEGECGCGLHHDHEDGECSCGHHHEHGEHCDCGDEHHHHSHQHHYHHEENNK